MDRLIELALEFLIFSQIFLVDIPVFSKLFCISFAICFFERPYRLLNIEYLVYIYLSSIKVLYIITFILLLYIFICRYSSLRRR